MPRAAKTIVTADIILMAQHKIAVSPVHWHWRYCSLALSHRYACYHHASSM